MIKQKDELIFVLNELINFLSQYRNQQNVTYFINTLQDILDYVSSVKEEQLSTAHVRYVQQMYKSMFFPRSGLSDFYVYNSDYALMKEQNEQYSLLLKKLHFLLSFDVSDK